MHVVDMRSGGRLATAGQFGMQIEMRVEVLQSRRGGDHCSREEHRLFKGTCHLAKYTRVSRASFWGSCMCSRYLEDALLEMQVGSPMIFTCFGHTRGE